MSNIFNFKLDSKSNASKELKNLVNSKVLQDS